MQCEVRATHNPPLPTEMIECFALHRVVPAYERYRKQCAVVGLSKCGI